MNKSERRTAIEHALDGPGGDDEIFRNVLSIMLDGLKVNDLCVTMTPAGHAKTHIDVELNGVKFTARRFVYYGSGSRLEVLDNDGPSVLKLRR